MRIRICIPWINAKARWAYLGHSWCWLVSRLIGVSGFLSITGLIIKGERHGGRYHRSAFLCISYVIAESQDEKIGISKDFEILFIFLLLKQYFFLCMYCNDIVNSQRFRVIKAKWFWKKDERVKNSTLNGKNKRKSMSNHMLRDKF